MKQIKLFVVFSFMYASTFGQVDFSTYYQDNAYIFNDEFKLLRTDLFTTYKSQFGLGTDDEMVLQDEGETILDGNGDGRTMARYIQKHKGYPVEGKMVNVMSKCGVVLMVNGSFLEGLNIDDNNLVSESAALTTALNHIVPGVEYFWDNTSLEDLLKDAEDDINATYYPEGELVIVKQLGENYDDNASNYELCWKFSVHYFDTATIDTTGIDTVMQTRIVYVNGTSGNIFASYNPEVHGYHQQASQWTWYDGRRVNEMVTYKCTTCLQFSLENRHRDIYTYQRNNLIFNKYRDQDNDWVDTDKKTGAQAFWAVNAARDYYFNKLYVPFGGNVKKLKIHCNSNLGGPARFVKDSKRPYFNVSKDNTNGYTSAAAFDVMAHEFTHFFISETCKLESGTLLLDLQESAALNEGFSDILGMLAERWKWGWCDWTVGEDLGAGWTKSFHSPHTDPFVTASDYGGTNWDVIFPHGNAGPLRKWFNRMSQGEWNWPIPYGGIGLDKSELLVRDLVTWNLWPRSGYNDARSQSMHIAAEHWGVCSPEWKAVERAWHDINLGGISNCKPGRLNGLRVVAESQVGDILNPVTFDAEMYYPEDVTVTGLNWTIPTNWTGTFTNNNKTFTLDNVNADYSSKTISVDVSYTENGSSYQETFETVLHFSSVCEIFSSKPGKPTDIETVVTLKDVEIYPNPTNKYIMISGTESGTIVQIFNVLGQETYNGILTEYIEKIDVAHFQPGVYTVSLKDKKGNTRVSKIIKQ